MGRPFAIRIEVNKLGALGARTRTRLAREVLNAATDLEAHAKTLAPHDTGTLMGSIKADMIGPLEAEVAVAAEYGAYVEFGTVRAAAQPYLGPALEIVEPGFRAAVGQIVREVSGE